MPEFSITRKDGTHGDRELWADLLEEDGIEPSAIELYRGQPRQKGGKFGQGKLQGGGTERQPANAIPLSEGVKVRMAQGGTPEELFMHLQTNAPDMVAETDRLVQHAHENAQPELDAGLRSIAKDLGFKFHDNIEDKSILDDASDYAVIGPVKSVARASVKVAGDLDGDVGLLKDVVRGSIAVQTPAAGRAAVEKLGSIGKVVQVRDRMTNPLETGYRDMNIHVRLKNSNTIAEIQVLMKPMLRVKNEAGHRMYEEMRVLSPTSKRYQTLLTASRNLYSAAWAAAGGAALLGG